MPELNTKNIPPEIQLLFDRAEHDEIGLRDFIIELDKLETPDVQAMYYVCQAFGLRYVAVKEIYIQKSYGSTDEWAAAIEAALDHADER